jgi:beta-galactosidase
VPTADHDVAFELSGPGRILGVGNGDPSSHEADHASRRRAFNGLCMAIVQGTKHVGAMTLRATSPGLKPGETSLTALAATTRPSLA